MGAPTAVFLDDLGAFAEAEGVRDTDLARPMGLLADALRRAVSVDHHPAQPSAPVANDHLAAALAVAVGVPGDLVRSIVDEVGWAAPYPEYAGEPDMDAMRTNYAYAPIVGAAEDAISGGAVSAPYLSDEVFVGLVLQGPGCDYPSHVHKAEEVFWVAAGTADWQKGDDWRVDEPGAVIHHPSGTRHATITRDEPLLMLFAWVSDPGSVPVIVRY
ncbi:MAG: dimethylsulfonioproprionate lyase family protein [Actinomycetota bacterium]|nr:dimethylsulfonioproprionate lyase family protein [Actinomycetota bacterium]